MWSKSAKLKALCSAVIFKKYITLGSSSVFSVSYKTRVLIFYKAETTTDAEIINVKQN